MQQGEEMPDNSIPTQKDDPCESPDEGGHDDRQYTQGENQPLAGHFDAGHTITHRNPDENTKHGY